VKRLLFCLTASLTLATGSDALIEGNPASTVRVVVYEDLQCIDCADFRRMMDQHLLPKFRDKVAFEHRDFPLAKHAWARPAAIAARYFASLKPELGVAWRRHALVNLKTISADNFNTQLAAFARKNGVDPDKALAALEDPALAAAVEKDFQEGVARGIAKTPTVLVNGEPFIERFPLANIVKAIERELAAAQ
jgi:protein-disulfide isomerase